MHTFASSANLFRRTSAGSFSVGSGPKGALLREKEPWETRLCFGQAAGAAWSERSQPEGGSKDEGRAGRSG